MTMTRGWRRRGSRAALALATLGALGAVGPGSARDDQPKPAGPATQPTPLAPLVQPVEGTTLELALVPVVPPATGDAKEAKAIRPFLIAKVETTWDLYDAFVFGFDQTDGKSASPKADAVTRPSKPYISMDRGFGHAGFPAISVSYNGAKAFCEWLSAKTGRTYRLPTVDEWKLACELGALPKDRLKEFAWHADNADGKTHAVGTLKADALGCHDLHGNASEWCVATDEKGNAKGVTVGGTFRDSADAVGCASIVPYSADWNASDPQFPKSRWWLADGGFVGFRVVCEAE